MMVNRIEFNEQLKRLTNVFSPLSPTAMEEYYNKFKLFDIGEIEEAIGILIDRPYEYTPKPYDIISVINEIRRNRPYMAADEEAPAPTCPECNGTLFETWYGADGYFKAKPCTHCDKGKMLNRGWQEYFSKIYKRELMRKEAE